MRNEFDCSAKNFEVVDVGGVISAATKAPSRPIVGENLLASIREVLGAGATEEVISAWTKAYGILAEILIGREGQIYHTHGKAQNGWVGFKPFRVLRTESESEVIASFYLQPADGAGVPMFNPGQCITVRIPDARGQTTMRNYSLSNAPGEDYFRISVKAGTTRLRFQLLS
jgi:nitric oxide dioxygenase